MRLPRIMRLLASAAPYGSDAPFPRFSAYACTPKKVRDAFSEFDSIVGYASRTIYAELRREAVEAEMGCRWLYSTSNGVFQP